MNREIFKRWAWGSLLSVVLTVVCILAFGVRNTTVALFVGLGATMVIQIAIMLVRR